MLVSAALVPTNPHWARVAGYGPFSLFAIYKEGLCPSSRDINGLMMIEFNQKEIRGPFLMDRKTLAARAIVYLGPYQT
jgi:hypothetical protein